MAADECASIANFDDSHGVNLPSPVRQLANAPAFASPNMSTTKSEARLAKMSPERPTAQDACHIAVGAHWSAGALWH